MKVYLLMGAALVFLCVLTFETRVGVPVSNATAGAVYGAFCSGGSDYDREASVCGCEATRVVPGGTGAWVSTTTLCPNGCGGTYTGLRQCGC